MEKVLGYYLLLINAAGLVIMCLDKLFAKKRRAARAGADASADRFSWRQSREPSGNASGPS